VSERERERETERSKKREEKAKREVRRTTSARRKKSLLKRKEKEEEERRAETIVYSEGRGHERQTLSCMVPSWGKAPGYDSFPWSVKRLRERWGGTRRRVSQRTYKMKTRSEMIKLRIFLAYAGIKGGLGEMECLRLDGREARSSLFHIWTISPKYGQF